MPLQFIIPVVAIIGMAWQAISSARPDSIGAMARNELRKEQAEVARNAEVEGIAKGFKGIQNAISVEERNNSELANCAQLLKNKVLGENRIASAMHKILSLETHELGKSALVREGFPEGQEIINMCRAENEILHRISSLLAEPENLGKRMEGELDKEYHRLVKAEHKVNFDERVVRAEGGEERQETQEERLKGRETRQTEDDLRAIGIDEKNMVQTVHRLLKDIADMMSLNDDIVHIVSRIKDGVSAEVRCFQHVKHDMGKKWDLMAHIIADVEEIAKFIKHARGFAERLGDTAHAFFSK